MEIAAEIDRVFVPIAAVVEHFSARHALALTKCVRGNRGWELTQPNPAGGTNTYLLMYDPTLGLGVGSVWQFRSVEMQLHYSHFRPMRACHLNPQDVAERLEEELHALGNVRFGYWTHLRPLQSEADDDS